MKHQFLIDTEGTIKTYVMVDNQIVVPSAATITLYKPGSTTEIVEDAVMTIAADGLLSYIIVAGSNDVVDQNYKAVITYTYNAETFERILFYDIVHSILYITIADEDVINELPTIRNKGYKTLGTAESGSTTTLVDTELKTFEDGHFTGGKAYSVTQDATRKITAFVASTGTVTTDAFGTAIATDNYILTRSFTKEIQRAFEKIEDLLVRSGRRPHLVMDSYDLKEVHIHYAVAEICKSFASESESIWWGLWEEYKKTGYAMFKTLKLKYDDDEDGTIIEPEEATKMGPRTSGRR